MKVFRASGERLIYRVQSDTEESVIYRVDLEAYLFRGQCDCPHFRCRLAPAIAADRKHRECKHIQAALMAFGRDILQQIKTKARIQYGTTSRDTGPS